MDNCQLNIIFLVATIIESIVLIGSLVAATVVYRRLTIAECKSRRCLVGKVVIVTGANVGIGYETALDLAQRGARVILASRDKNKGQYAVNKIIKATGNENVYFMLLNLASFESVRSFVEQFNKKESKLDILINNAGLVSGKVRETTGDGHELTFQTNHLGPALLTMLLLPTLKRNPEKCRVVIVSSRAARQVKRFDLTDLETHNYSSWTVYCKSKLENMYFTRELALNLKDTNIIVNCLHPGFVATELFRNTKGILGAIVSLSYYYMKSPKQGAQTTIHCAIDESVADVTGEYYENCNIATMPQIAKDDVKCSEFWKVTMQMIDAKEDLLK